MNTLPVVLQIVLAVGLVCSAIALVEIWRISGKRRCKEAESMLVRERLLGSILHELESMNRGVNLPEEGLWVAQARLLSSILRELESINRKLEADQRELDRRWEREDALRSRQGAA